MDLNTVVEYIPVVLAATAGLLAGAWGLFKVIAKLTKTPKDDAFIEKHGDTVEDVIDKMDGPS